MPWELLRVIEHANTVLDWYENFTKDEMPPQWMWHLDHELEEWFKEVTRLRDEKYGTSSRSDDREQVPMMENEFASARR